MIPSGQTKRSALTIAVVVVCAACAATAFAYRQDIRDTYVRILRGPVPPEITRTQAQQQTAPETTTPKAVEAAQAAPAVPAAARPTEKLPAQMNLKVPFILQAPFQNWDALHEDACEEAAALMLQAYDKGETGPFTPDEMDRRIHALADYEDATYGGNRDTDAARTAQFMRDFLGLKATTVLPIVSADDIRHEIAAGHPVAVPADGKLLHNPNFKNGGPLYHMIVLKGYRADGTFITNDSGTRMGADYVYDEATIMNAAHDWNGGDVTHGARVMIVVQD